METDENGQGYGKKFGSGYSGGSGGHESKVFGGSGTSGFKKSKGMSVCKFFVQGTCKSQSCSFLHAFSPMENIDLKASAKVSESSTHDIAVLNIGDKAHLITLNSEGHIAVFSPEENKVIETFEPDGKATCIRVFPQFNNILFVAYTKSGPGGTPVGILLAQAGPDRMEVEAHEGYITDIICLSVNEEQFKGEVFFTSSTDCKIKAWRIDEGTLSLLHSIDSPTNSVVNCLSSYGSDLVFGGCEDGSIIAWNILSNSTDCMKPENMKQICSVCISKDAIGCDVLVVGTKTGFMDMFNISHGFKQFTSAMAYVDAPVNKVISFTDTLGIEKGMFSVGDDGCISVWQWQPPKKKDFKSDWDSRGRGSRGGYRGRGRGSRGGHNFQGTQGRGF